MNWLYLLLLLGLIEGMVSNGIVLFVGFMVIDGAPSGCTTIMAARTRPNPFSNASFLCLWYVVTPIQRMAL